VAAAGGVGKIRPSTGPLAARAKLVDELGAAAASKKRQPAGAAFADVLRQVGPGDVAAAMQAAERVAPQFGPLQPATIVPAKIVAADSHDEHRKLLAAAFLSASMAGARATERVAGGAGEPRWKPLGAALPARPMGKIIPVLGVLLQRSVRAAGQDALPEIFEIRIRPIGFPRYSPRMGILEERAHRTDRIGIDPGCPLAQSSLVQSPLAQSSLVHSSLVHSSLVHS